MHLYLEPVLADTFGDFYQEHGSLGQVPRMGHIGEAACDCVARRKVAMADAAYHVNAEQKKRYFMFVKNV